jgi:hypothetical protein
MSPRSTVWSYAFFLLACGLVLIACGSAYADKVSVDWDHHANFGQYKTYAWVDSKNPAQDQLMGTRIMQAVDGQLRAKGLQRVEPGQDPDLTVVYEAGVQQKVSWVPYPWGPAWDWGWAAGPGWGPGWGWNGGWGWWGGPDAYYPVVQDIGTLSVNIVDEHQKQLVWRGVASDALKDNPEKNARKICELVSKMFRRYPPMRLSGNPSSCC